MLKEFVVSSEANFTIERLEYLSSKEIIQLIKTTLRHLDEARMTNQKDELWKAEIKNILAEIKPAFNCMHMKSLNHNENCTSYSIKGKHNFSVYDSGTSVTRMLIVLNYRQLLSLTYITVDSRLTESSSTRLLYSHKNYFLINRLHLSIYHEYPTCVTSVCVWLT